MNRRERLVRLESLAKWKQIVFVVRKVIHDWDPYGLLGMGAPEDEWDGEIASIVVRVREIRSEGDATRIVSEVFSKAFNARRFGIDDCADVGQKLYSALSEAHLITSEEVETP